jgi:hypothetical protein
MLLTKALLVVGLYELQILRQAQWSTETRRPGHCFSVEISKRMISVVIMPYGQTISLDLYIKTIKTLQTCFRRVRLDKNVAAVLQHDNAGNNHTNRMTYYSPPTIQTRFCSLKSLTLWNPERCHTCEKLREWKRGYWRSEEVVASKMLLLISGLTLWRWWKLCRKMRCVIYQSSYPTTMFQELYT